MRRMMLMEASWPSNSDAAVTKRTAVCVFAARVADDTTARSVIVLTPPITRRGCSARHSRGLYGRRCGGATAPAQHLIQRTPAFADLLDAGIFDMAVTPNLLGQARQLDRPRQILRAQVGERRVYRLLIVRDQLPLHAPFGGPAKYVQRTATQELELREQLER